MKKEITVTINENSHKHAEMIIHTIADPELAIFYKSNSYSIWGRLVILT